MESLVILIPVEGESWSAFLRRAHDTEGEMLLLLSGIEPQLKDHAERRKFFEACMDIRSRTRIATKRPLLLSAARLHGFRFVSRTQELRIILENHPALEEALRVFSPHLWRQKLRSQLQAIGLLSLPKIRIWLLILMSFLLFLFVLFWLLPSAEVRVKPRQDTITHTVNIFLVQTGAVAAIPERVRTIPLKPIVITLNQSITFDRISKEFSGTNARVPMTVVNTSRETYSFRKGSRLVNQAGMVFRIQEPVFVQPGGKTTVMAEADPLDTYGQILGDRANVPAGRKWEFAGLPTEEKSLVYAENLLSASGGITSYRTILSKDDLKLAEKQLENDLLLQAKQMVDEERLLWNAQHPDQQLEMLYYDELTKTQFKDFVLPTAFVEQPVSSVPIDGTIVYTAYGYDTKAVLDLLTAELKTHVGEGKRILEDTLNLSRLIAHVIDYAEDLSWIKLTVDLSGTEQYVLDPLTPMGAQFAKKVREKVVGMPAQDAQRIVKNFPEVDSSEISIWPPWSTRLPPIPSHIFVTPEAGSS